jgi:DUF4097 and DUF4098 domain-containing protein YvlB
MKKLVIILFTIFLSLPLFADPKNIVYNEAFSFLAIENLDISLTYENLQISRIYGDEIVIEIGSNNIKKIPQVSVQNETLRIISNEQKTSRGNKCNVYLYLPQDFDASEIKLHNVSGSITADILQAQNAVLISNVSGRTDIASCQTELYKATSVSGNITLQKIAVDFFDFSSTSGTVFAELEQAPLASSKITNTSGKSQLYYPKFSNFELSTFTVSGSIKTPDSDSNKKTAGTNYQSIIGTGGPQISISSVSGKIEITAY